MRIERYERSDHATGLLNWLQQAHVEDKEAEALAKKGCGVGLLGGVLLFLGMGFLEGAPLAGIIMAGLGIAAIVAGVRWHNLGQSQDLDDDKLAMAMRLLRYLQADFVAGKPIHMVVDFEDTKLTKNIVADRGMNKVYSQPWLEMRGSLRNGATLALEISRDSKVRTSFNARGRRKEKEKFRDCVSVSLKGATQEPFDLNRIKSGLGASPPAVEVKDLKTQGNKLKAVLRTQPTITKTKKGFTQHLSSDNSLRPGGVLHSLVWLFRAIYRVEQQPG